MTCLTSIPFNSWLVVCVDALVSKVFLPFWKRYVDDTCTVVPIDRKDDLLTHLNQIEDSIKFTLEEESEGCLAFLDVLIMHEDDGTISTSGYRKTTHTDKYLDFDSHHPLCHKTAVVNTLLTRACEGSV